MSEVLTGLSTVRMLARGRRANDDSSLFMIDWNESPEVRPGSGMVPVEGSTSDLLACPVPTSDDPVVCDGNNCVGILGVGAHVPPRIVTNDEIANWSGADREWIAARTGVSERRYAAAGTAMSDLARYAVAALAADCDARVEDVDLILVATSTPDQPQPATAAILQGKLGLDGQVAFDINAVCAGFLYALQVASIWLRAGEPDGSALVVGADMYSTVMDRADRRTVSLFGDGAGAVLVGAVPAGYGLHSVRLATHGSLCELVEVPAGGTRQPLDAAARAAGRHLFRMQGRTVREYALATLPDLVQDVLRSAGLDISEIDRLVVHQGNTRLVEQVAAHLGVPMHRVPLTAPLLGNTGAASLPVTLRAAHEREPLRRDERVLMVAVGGGMSAGAAVMTWY